MQCWSKKREYFSSEGRRKEKSLGFQEAIVSLLVGLTASSFETLFKTCFTDLAKNILLFKCDLSCWLHERVNALLVRIWIFRVYKEYYLLSDNSFEYIRGNLKEFINVSKHVPVDGGGACYYTFTTGKCRPI